MTSTVPCVLCCLPSNYPTNYPNKRKPKLNDQLAVVFLLRNILKIPKSLFESLLEKRGNPTDWIASCTECSKLLINAQKICTKLAHLKNELNTLECQINGILQNSIKTAALIERKPTVEAVNIFASFDEIRKFICKDILPWEELDEDDSHHFEFDELQIKSENESTPQHPFDNDEFDSAILNEDPLHSPAPLVPWFPQVPTSEAKIGDRAQKFPVLLYGPLASPNKKEDKMKIPAESKSKTQIQNNQRRKDVKTRKKAKKKTKKEENVLGVKPKRERKQVIYRDDLESDYEISVEETDNAVDADWEMDNNLDAEIAASLFDGRDQQVTEKETDSTELGNNDNCNYGGKEEHHCDLCGKSFRGIKSLSRHMNDVHPEEFHPKKQKCRICVKYVFAKHMKAHLAKVHSNEVKHFCPTCNAGFVVKRKLDMHRYKEHKADKPHRCSFCPKTFTVPKDKKHHEISTHTKEYEHICEFCAKGYAKKSSLTIHLLSHTSQGAKAYTCELCGQDFWKSNCLVMHQRGWHYEELGLEPYKCPTCDKIFKGLLSLKQHRKREHDKEFIHCEICNHKFVCATRLKLHIRVVHNGELPYQCEYCPMKVATPRQLQDHVQLHTGYKYICNICSKGFTNSYNLNAHLKVHSRNGQPKERKRKTLKV